MGSHPLQPGDAMQEKTISNSLIHQVTQVAMILFVRYTPGN